MIERAIAEKVLEDMEQEYRVGKSATEWEAIAKTAIDYFEDLEASWPEPFADSGLWAAREWHRLIKAGATTEAQTCDLFLYISKNKERGMPWRTLSSDIGKWLYSNGQPSALTLHTQRNIVQAFLLQADSDA